MTELEILLKYQDVDNKLIAIEQEIARSEERKNYFTAKKFLEKAAPKLEMLDNKAVDLNKRAESLTRDYIALIQEVKEFDKIDELVDGGADVDFYLRSAQGVSEKLRVLKQEINNLVSTIKSIQEEYKSMKKQTITVNKQFKEYKVKYGELKDSKSKEMEKLTAELEGIEKKAKGGYIEIYKTKRRERLYPVACPEVGDRCGYCKMEIPIAYQSKLDSGDLIECDSCHRLLYKNK